MISIDFVEQILCQTLNSGLFGLEGLFYNLCREYSVQKWTNLSPVADSSQGV